MAVSKFVVSLVMVSALALTGCSSGGKSKKSKALDPFAGVGSPYYPGSGKVPLGGGRRHVGKPYQVAGRWFHPKDMSSYDKTGPASWYGKQFHRRKTSNGEWFDMNELTAAHATMPLPSYAKVTNLENGAEVIVRVNDRGPFVGDRIIDMSRRSAEVLGFKDQGKAEVRVQLIGPAPLDDKGPHLAAMNRELKRGTPLRKMIARAGGADRTSTAFSVAKAEPAAPEPPAPGHDYFVQVASFSDETNAEQARAALSSVGPVEVQPLEGSGGTVFRVRVGPLADQGQAETALQRVVDQGHEDARLVMASNAS